MNRTFIAAGGAAVALIALLLLNVSPNAMTLEPDPDLDSRPGQGPCPEGGEASGPAMVRLPEGFCIDTTEVTRGHYEAWLASEPATSGQVAGCEANDDYTPTCAWDPGSNEGRPVVCVDWCDAHAFCAAAGKRLCGTIGDGSAYPFEQYADPAVSEWHAACTSGGRYEYTYGNALNTETCRGADAEDYTTWGLGDSGEFGSCHSPDTPYDAVMDLSGNAAEWDNSCEGEGPDAPCRIRGGSYEHNEHGLRCAMGQALRWPRDRTVSSVGFRCCAD